MRRALVSVGSARLSCAVPPSVRGTCLQTFQEGLTLWPAGGRTVTFDDVGLRALQAGPIDFFYTSAGDAATDRGFAAGGGAVQALIAEERLASRGPVKRRPAGDAC